MKKSLLLSMVCFCMGCIQMAAAVTLQPEQCDVGTRPFVYPLESIGMNFDGGIILLNGAKAEVKCDGVAVAVATELKTSNYVGQNRTQGTLEICFEKQNLPIGKDYVLVVAPGSIAKETDSSVVNDVIKIPFNVPATLGEIHSDIPAVVSTAKSLWIYWGTETDPVGEPEFTLYRNGQEIRKVTARVAWDWNLGQAYADFGSNVNFENGVKYRLTLPAGSVSSCYRDDIVNEEVVIDFTGGYTEPVKPLMYVWCSLFTDHSDELDVVSFTYDRPVRVSDGAKLQLWEVDGESPVIEADAYLSTEDGRWIVSADFGGFKMQPEVGYTFVIPEGSVIAEDGDPVVNLRNVLALNGSSGIKNIVIDNTDDETPFYDLSGRIVINPQPGTIYIQHGKKIIVK